MKILMILSSPDKTGLTTHTVDLAEALVRLNHDVTILTTTSIPLNSEQRFFIQLLRNNGIKVTEIQFRKGFFGKIMTVLLFLKHMLIAQYDVIHVQSPYYTFLPWVLRKKFVSTLHVNDLVRCFYYKNATHLIAISQETKDYAKSLYGYKDQDITIVNHGVSMRFSTMWSDQEKTDFKLKNGIPLNKIIILLVGSIEKRKGHDLLLKSVFHLPSEIKDKVHLVFVGSSKDGRTNGWLKDLVDQYGENRVSCFSYQDPECFYKVSDIFVLPSRLEGFPLVVIEAMLSGCCVIRSNTEGASEQIDSGINGFIFENENVEQLTEILNMVIIDDDLRNMIAVAGKEKALTEFTSEVMARKTLEVYKKII